MKIRRNQPCPCGSGLKYKKCHGSPLQVPFRDPHEIQRMLDLHRAKQRIRVAQQGQGRPIIAVPIGDHVAVAVGAELYPMKECKTFPDFLSKYIKIKLGREWGNAEIAKPMADEQHPILQWYHDLCLYQQATIKTPGEVASAKIIGVVGCYLGLAYGLYLLAHNVELQERLLHRLKDRANFQGAYYEVIVARMLILAGFTLQLEDETDGLTKHCEFSATKDGRKYWVEAKMRSIAGILGKTLLDGGTDTKPIKKLVQHLNGAFAKPAKDARLIFIDLNTAQGLDETGATPRWIDDATKRLVEYEGDTLPKGESAYLFVTNVAYHRRLDSHPVRVLLPFGLGCDFVKPGAMTLGERYRLQQRHRHGHEIINAFKDDLNFPTTFDGSLPSETFGSQRRALIGETYLFEDVGEHGIIGTVTAATVNEPKSEAVLAIATRDCGQIIITRPMSVDEMHDYRHHPDAYFGQVTTSGRRIDDPYELFEWFMEVYKGLPRANLLSNLAAHPALVAPERMSDEDLRIMYCESLVANALARRKAA